MNKKQIEACSKDAEDWAVKHNLAYVSEQMDVIFWSCSSRESFIRGWAARHHQNVGDMDHKTPTTVIQRFGDAMQLLCNGNRPTNTMLADWLGFINEDLQTFAAEHGPGWAQGIGIIEAALTLVNQPTEILTPYNDKDHERLD